MPLMNLQITVRGIRIRDGCSKSMPMRSSLAAVVLVFLVCHTVLCQQVGNATRTANSCLVLISGATNVKHYNLPGLRKQLSYHIQSPYPADEVLDTIKQKLQLDGWKPLRADFLNPKLPSSHVRGWDYYQDQATKPVTSVWAWQADWKNIKGEIVTYRLEYRCPDSICSSTENLRDLQVIAIYVPARQAEQMNR
jgi:hypothetical protein